MGYPHDLGNNKLYKNRNWEKGEVKFCMIQGPVEDVWKPRFHPSNDPGEHMAKWGQEKPKPGGELG